MFNLVQHTLSSSLFVDQWRIYGNVTSASERFKLARLHSLLETKLLNLKSSQLYRVKVNGLRDCT